jgi:hypothetical protein
MMPPSLRLKHDPSKTTSSLPPSLKLKEKKEEFQFEEENDLDREIERNIAQQTSRMAESILGAPGDIWSFAKSVFGYDSETDLPTSKSLRKKSEELSLGYTKPENEFEEKAGELQQDISSFMLPGSRTYSLARNIGIPLAANLAKEGVGSILGKKGDEAKIGTMVILDLISNRGKGGAKGYASSLFQNSEKAIPQGTKISSSNLTTGLNEIYNSLKKGGSTPSKSSSMKKIREILKKSKGGEIEVKELIEYRKSINELLDQAKAFNPFKDPKIQGKKIKNLQNVKSKVIDSLDEYGKINPEFGKLNKAANEAWGAYEGSKKMSQVIKEVGSKVLRNPISQILFLGTSGATHHFPQILSYLGLGAKGAVVGAPFVFGAHETYKIMHQIVKSPTLAKYYGNVLKGAASGNLQQVSKNMKKLDEKLEKENLNMVQKD